MHRKRRKRGLLKPKKLNKISFLQNLESFAPLNLGEDKEMETMACKNPKMQTKEHLQDFSFKGPLSHFVLISKK